MSRHSQPLVRLENLISKQYRVRASLDLRCRSLCSRLRRRVLVRRKLLRSSCLLGHSFGIADRLAAFNLAVLVHVHTKATTCLVAFVAYVPNTLSSKILLAAERTPHSRVWPVPPSADQRPFLLHSVRAVTLNRKFNTRVALMVQQRRAARLDAPQKPWLPGCADPSSRPSSIFCVLVVFRCCS